jgi:copper transport protein
VPPPNSGESLDDFLADGERRERGARWFGHAGRILGFVGAVVGIGAVAFVALVLGGRSPDGSRAVGTASGAGIIAAVGAVIEGVGHAGEVTGEGLSIVGDPGEAVDVLSSTFGAAVVLRLSGGLVLAFGCWLAGRSERSPIPSPLMLAGSAALLVSFTFDGHTVSEGPRPLHALVDMVHVGAASAWAGGVVVLAALAWRHRRATSTTTLAGSTVSAAARAGPAPLLEAGLRFSVVAMWALLAVAAAGVLMAVMILDDLGELTSTPWGRTLLVKIGAVAVAAACGLYNRRRALPALEAAPEDPALQEQLRGLLTAEAIVLVFVVVITTWLVGAVV